jgi:hypothetical protein
LASKVLRRPFGLPGFGLKMPQREKRTSALIWLRRSSSRPWARAQRQAVREAMSGNVSVRGSAGRLEQEHCHISRLHREHLREATPAWCFSRA